MLAQGGYIRQWQRFVVHFRFVADDIGVRTKSIIVVDFPGRSRYWPGLLVYASHDRGDLAAAHRL